MALKYKNQSEIEALNKTLSDNSAENYVSNYKSDLRTALFGGRSGSYGELHYVRNRTSDVEAPVADNIEVKLSDSWIHNRATTGTATPKRYTEAKQITFEIPKFIN